jgi:predicted transposase YbfD/YdcC
VFNVNHGHGRIEWRGIEVKDVTPEQMGFPHAAQVARIDRIRELKGGKQETETVWIITSLSAPEASAEALLELVRTYWTIENGTHYPLDVSAGEDRCRVRNPVAATVYGILKRAVQGEYRAWERTQTCKRNRTYPTFRERMGRRINLAVRFATGSAIRL